LKKKIPTTWEASLLVNLIVLKSTEINFDFQQVETRFEKQKFVKKVEAQWDRSKVDFKITTCPMLLYVGCTSRKKGSLWASKIRPTRFTESIVLFQPIFLKVGSSCLTVSKFIQHDWKNLSTGHPPEKDPNFEQKWQNIFDYFDYIIWRIVWKEMIYLLMILLS
jgi:hypothetical protein